MSDPTDLDEILAGVLAREAADRARQSPELGPPEPEELLDFLRGDVPAEKEEELHQRILTDPEASRALLDIEALVRDAETAATSTTGDLASTAGWRELQGRLQAPGQASSQEPAGDATSPEASTVAARSSSFWLQPIAAALFLTTVGLSILLLQRPLAPVVTLANLQTLELIAGQRSAGDEKPVTVAPGEPLSLLLDPETDCPTYRLTISRSGSGSGNTPIIEELNKDTLGARGMLVALVQLSPGSYTAILEGCSPLVELERHSFQVMEAP